MAESEYQSFVINTSFFTLPAWFVFFMPFRVPYGKLEEKAKEAGFTPVSENGVIEMGKSFGKGWIGIEIKEQDLTHESIKKLSGEFKSHEYVGPYNKMGEAYKEIMKDNPEAKEYYNLYLNRPDEVPVDKLRTMILFR